MALDLNESNKEVLQLSGLYTGLCIMKVVAINPSMEEIKGFGLPAIKEPVYTTEENIENDLKEVIGTYKRTRVDIYLKSVERAEYPKQPIQAKLAFFIDERDRVSQKKDKEQWINIFGATCWVPTGTTPDKHDSIGKWFKMDGARKAKSGEEQITEWLKAYANVETGKRCQLETIAAIATGDVSELRKYHHALQNNEVKYLLGVKENKYQSVYEKMFGRTYEKTTTRWIKQLEDPFGKFDADYQNALDLRSFTGKLSTPDNMGGNTGGEAPNLQGGQKLIF